MNYQFKVYRNVDAWRLRKIVIELWRVNDNGASMDPLPLDRCRIFGGLPVLDPLLWILWSTFAKRLARRQDTMIKRAKIMLEASHLVEIV